VDELGLFRWALALRRLFVEMPKQFISRRLCFVRANLASLLDEEL
jgi:hypothetical protein